MGPIWQRSDLLRNNKSHEKTTALCVMLLFPNAKKQTQVEVLVEVITDNCFKKIRTSPCFFVKFYLEHKLGGPSNEVFSPAVSHLAQPLLLSQGAHQFALLSPLFTWFLRNFPQRQKGVRCEIQKQNRQPICAKRRCIYMYIYGHEFLVGIKRADSGPCCFNTYSTKPSV